MKKYEGKEEFEELTNDSGAVKAGVPKQNIHILVVSWNRTDDS